MLPPYYVFLVAALNSLFITLGILYLPHQADLAQALKTSGVGLISLPIAIQFVVAILAFIWVQSATRAIIRADRAEQIAHLEHDIAESRQLVADQKAELDVAIQEITHALLSSSNGRTFGKISTQGSPLWTIVGPINNILARMERMRQTEHDYQQLTVGLEHLLFDIYHAQNTGQTLRMPTSATSATSARLGLFYQEIATLQTRDTTQRSSVKPFFISCGSGEV